METVKLLGVTIDSKMKFDDHIKALCKTANKIISAFSRVANYLKYEKGKTIYNTLIMSNFNYCPLIWDLDVSWEDLKKSGRSYPKKALRILHNDFNVLFEVLLERTDE